jgi:hypothetical protein
VALRLHCDCFRAELIRRDIAVSEVFHDEGGAFHHAGTKGHVAGPDPQGRSYNSRLSFNDPDGNGWGRAPAPCS